MYLALGNYVSEEGYTGDVELKLLRLKSLFSKSLEYLVDMQFMFDGGLGKNRDIVQVNKNKTVKPVMSLNTSLTRTSKLVGELVKPNGLSFESHFSLTPLPDVDQVVKLLLALMSRGKLGCNIQLICHLSVNEAFLSSGVNESQEEKGLGAWGCTGELHATWLTSISPLY